MVKQMLYLAKKIGKVITIILCFLILGTSTAFIYAQLADSPWPMYRHDPQRTGRSQYVGPQTNEVKWTFSIPEGAYNRSGPTINQNGTVYLLSSKHLLAISAQGELKWKYPLPTTPLRLKAPLIGPNGTIYIGTVAKILAISPTGILKWETRIKSPLSAFTSRINPYFVLEQNTLYFVDVFKLNGHYRPLLTAFDAENGNLLWVFDLEQEQKHSSFEDENIPQVSLATPPSVPAIARDGNIYLGFKESLLSLDTQGSLRWKKTFTVEKTLDNNISTISIGIDETVYLIVRSTHYWSSIGSEGYYDSLYAIGSDGEEKWEFRGGNLANLLIGPNETIYLNNTTWAFDHWRDYVITVSSQGNLEWSVQKGNYSLDLVDGEGNTYGKQGSYRVLALDSQGDEIWSYYTGYPNNFSFPFALSSDSTLYAPTPHTLFAFGPIPTTGTISGKVTDSSTGEGINGATISANAYSTTTDSNGNYSLSLPGGTYTITASADGYESQTQSNINVIAAQTTTINFSLEPILLSDLAVMDIYVVARPPSVYIPNTVTISTKLKNEGGVVINSFQAEFYINETKKYSESKENLKLASGETTVIPFQWTLDTSGDVEIKIKASNINPPDNNSDNDILTKSFSVYYIPFDIKKDAYSFENPSYIDWNKLKYNLDQHEEIFLTGVNFWSLAKLFKREGYCHGMSATTILYKEGTIPIPSEKKTVYELKPTDPEAMENISDSQHSGSSLATHASRLIDRLRGNLPSASGEYLKIMDSLQKAELVMLSLGNSDNLFKAHEVVAYQAIKDLEDNTAQVFIYDSNEPGIECIAYFDFKDGTFNYKEYNIVWAERPVSLPLEIIKEKLNNLSNSIDNFLRSAGQMLLDVFSPVDTLITDEHGRRIGYLNGSPINEIPDAIMETFGDIETYRTSLALNYNIQLTGTDAGTFELHMARPNPDDTTLKLVYQDVSTPTGAVATLALGPSAINYVMQLDIDGDAVIDKLKHPNYIQNLVVDIQATIDIDPDTLNLKSKGKWITCYIELREGYDVKNINIDDIELMVNESVITQVAESSPSEVNDYDKDNIPDLMVKFDRAVLIEYIKQHALSGEVTLTVVGKVNNEVFAGTDTITIKGAEGASSRLEASQPKFSLSQNYPNPCNPETTIEYSLAESCNVTLKIYNMAGQLIKILVNEYQDAGLHKVTWYGDNDAGQEVASGVYFYRIKAGDFVSTKKMVVLK